MSSWTRLSGSVIGGKLVTVLDGPLPAIAGKYRGKSLIICGDAACVWDDLERFGCRHDHGRGSVRKDGWHFLTINRLVETFPGVIEHAYSNEPELLLRFIAARRYEYKTEFGGPAHTHSCNKGAQWRWPWSGRGTSALGAALIGLALGYDPVVLAGVPLDDSPHNGEPPWRKTTFAKPQDNWQQALPHLAKARSLSGRTRTWLGEP